MDDLISRQAAIDAINTHFGFNIEEEYGSAVQEVINGLPSVQPEQKKGKWIVTGTFFDFLKCSCCGYKTPWNQDVFNFCPKCGADMRERK